MKILRYPYKITCSYCRCKIAFSEKDIKKDTNVYGEPLRYIQCPNCTGDIYINKGEKVNE